MLELLLVLISILVVSGVLWCSWRSHANSELEKIHQRVKSVVYKYDIYDTGELMVELKQNGIRASWIPQYLQALYSERVIEFKTKNVFKVINRKEKLY